MKRKLYHPVWVHIPAFTLLAVFIYIALSAMPMPDRVPMHFDLAGNPNSWGSPWQMLIFIPAMTLFWIAISIFGDELWARQEKQKTFNWMSIIDEVIIGFLVGVFASWIQAAVVLPGPFVLSKQAVLPWVLLPLAAAIVLELKRPFHPFQEKSAVGDTSAQAAEFTEKLTPGTKWGYWESQNPWWTSLLVIVVSIWMLVGAVTSWSQSHVTAIIVGIFSPAMWLLYGGIRVFINADAVIVRLGFIGVPLKSLPLKEIAEVSVHEFSPLRDFGGYGIRVNRQMTAYYFSGNHGVLIVTTTGKKYLIGSDHPDKLAAVIEAARKTAG